MEYSALQASKSQVEDAFTSLSKVHTTLHSLTYIHTYIHTYAKDTEHNAYIQIYNTYIYIYIQKMELLEVAAAAETDNLTLQLSTATERVDALQKETLALKVSLILSA